MGVTHYVYKLLREAAPGTDSSATRSPLSPSQLPPVMQFALLVSALCHDIDHPGHRNDFEVLTKSPLTRMYGEVAVLEQHHIATAEELLKHHGCDLLEMMNDQEQALFRRVLRDSIMATDMSAHGSLVAEIEHRANNNNHEEASLGEDWQLFVCRAVLHAADLSSCVRKFAVASNWAERIDEEFASQVRKEVGAGLRPEADLKKQEARTGVQRLDQELQFLLAVARPMWTAVVRLWPTLALLQTQLESNISQYHSIRDQELKREKA